jgi:hypothetical protein
MCHLNRCYTATHLVGRDIGRSLKGILRDFSMLAQCRGRTRTVWARVAKITLQTLWKCPNNALGDTYLLFDQHAAVFHDE